MSTVSKDTPANFLQKTDRSGFRIKSKFKETVSAPDFRVTVRSKLRYRLVTYLRRESVVNV